MREKADQSLNIFDLIDQVCAEFRKQWKAEKRPLVEEFLPQVPEDARSQLFRNLLPIDILFRRKKKESPSSDEYRKRFPAFAEIIREAFLEPTIASMDPLESTPPDESFEHTVTFDSPSVCRIGDYEILDKLGQGGFGVVYRARHRTLGNVVALKTLPTGIKGQEVVADRLHRFRNEFRSLAEINHPNLIGMQTLEVDGNQWFLTMDLVDGCTFLDFVRPNSMLDEQRLRSGMQKLAEGLITLHRHGIIHRDLKPSNVLVDMTGRVVILDFGLVAPLTAVTDQTASMRSEMFAGTPLYAAPEQMLGDWSSASDWYAVGVMLYQALSGDTPFAGSPAELFRAKQEFDPPTLIGRVDIPKDLAELAEGLLLRSPSDRPGPNTVSQFLDVAQVLCDHGSQASSSTSSLELGSAIELSDSSTVLVGRESQLDAMESARIKMVERQGPGVVWIRGLSGEGKSALAEAFVGPFRRSQEMLVLSGRCYDRESLPFKAIDCLIDPLVSFLRTLEMTDLDSLLPDDISFLARLFPLLRRVDAIAACEDLDLKHIDSQQVTARAFKALRFLMVMLSHRMPLVVLIDDLQWGDSDSARFLFDLLRGDQPPTMLFLAGYRRDEADNSPFLREWNLRSQDVELETPQDFVDVHPLSQEQCLELAAIRTGMTADALRIDTSDLLRDSGGNPYFIEQLLSGFDRDSGSIRDMNLEEIIRARLVGLPAEAKALLEIVAISGHPLDLSIAIKSADLDASVVSTATRMRSERLFRIDESDDGIRVDTYHDKIRESVIHGMAEEQRRRWHLRLAETLEKDESLTADDWRERVRRPVVPGHDDDEVPACVFDLAYHFLAAGDERAFVYQLLAAERSMLAFAIDDALAHFGRVQALLPDDASPPLRTRILLGRGRVYHWNKDLPQASEALRRAIELSSVTETTSLAYRRMTNLVRHLGETYDESIKWMDLGLEQFGFRRARSTTFKLINILRHSMRIMLVPTWFGATRSEEKRLRLSIGYRLLENGQSLIESDALAATETMLWSAVMAMRTGEPKSMRRGMAHAAYTFSMVGAHPLARRMLRRSEAIEVPTADLEDEGFLVMCRAMGNYWSGSLTEADKEFERAIGLFSRCLVPDLEAVSSHMMRHVCAFLSPSSRELEFAKRVVRNSTEARHGPGMCWGHYDSASAQARIGRLREAWLELWHAWTVLQGTSMGLTESIFYAVVSFVRIQSSDYVGAHSSAVQSRSSAFRQMAANDVALFSMPLELEAACGADWNKECTTEHRKTLRRIMRRNAMTYAMLPNHQPHMLRAAGRAAAALGNKRKAVRSFQKAVKLAAKKGMDYQRARSLLDIAAVKEEAREANRAEAINLLKKMESVIPHAESWLLGDQYDEAVVAPEFDLQAWENEHGTIPVPQKDQPRQGTR